MILEVGASTQIMFNIVHLCRHVICKNPLCVILDENVEVIYICPQHLGGDILDYYTSLLKCDGTTDGVNTTAAQASSSMRRYIILTPEAVDYFPVRMTVFTNLFPNVNFYILKWYNAPLE